MQAGRHIVLAVAHVLGFLTLLAAASGCEGGANTAVNGVGGQVAVSPLQTAKLHQYQAEVLPTLQQNCLRCHGGMNRRGGLNMSTRASLLQGGKDGAVVVVGRPDDSLLVRLINPQLPESDPMRMPPKGERLTAAQVAAIRKWVADGIVMDR